jgi:hypothetical protein
MGIDLWSHAKFLHHKVRNMSRRGWLVKTYYDKKLMQVRFKTGEKLENDRIDLVQPAGFLGRTKPNDKVEVISMDIGGDTSRRVCMGVIGDRQWHPKIEEGESILYNPGDASGFVRVYKKPQDGGGASTGEFTPQALADMHAAESQEGIHANHEKAITETTKDTHSVKADKGQQREAPVFVYKGNFLVQGNITATGDINGGNSAFPAWESHPSPMNPLRGRSEYTFLDRMAAFADSLARQPRKAIASDRISIDANGTLIIDGDLIVNGDVRVNGTVTAKDFVRA